MPRVYLANNDGSNLVYLDAPHAPWPEVPDRGYERAGSSDRMILGWDGANKVPGRVIHQDAGTHESAGQVEIIVPLVDEDLLASLNLKYASLDAIRYSPDDGINVWKVSWQAGRSLDPKPVPGFPGFYRVTMKFNIVQKL